MAGPPMEHYSGSRGRALARVGAIDPHRAFSMRRRIDFMALAAWLFMTYGFGARHLHPVTPAALILVADGPIPRVRIRSDPTDRSHSRSMLRKLNEIVFDIGEFYPSGLITEGARRLVRPWDSTMPGRNFCHCSLP
jgi:hypothetical protein